MVVEKKTSLQVSQWRRFNFIFWISKLLKIASLFVDALRPPVYRVSPATWGGSLNGNNPWVIAPLLHQLQIALISWPDNHFRWNFTDMFVRWCTFTGHTKIRESHDESTWNFSDSVDHRSNVRKAKYFVSMVRWVLHGNHIDFTWESAFLVHIRYLQHLVKIYVKFERK